MKKGIITYDISSTKERNKIAKLLSAYGKRIQYSVFEFELPNNIYEELFQKITNIAKDFKGKKLIKSDLTYSIRIYFLCDSCLKKSYIFEDKKNKYEIEGNIY